VRKSSGAQLSVFVYLSINRFIFEFNTGYGSSVTPTYINEVSPISLRGTLGASFQLGIVLLLFVSQVISLDSVLGSANNWHYALGKDYLKFIVMKFVSFSL